MRNQPIKSNISKMAKQKLLKSHTYKRDTILKNQMKWIAEILAQQQNGQQEKHGNHFFSAASGTAFGGSDSG